MYNSKTYRDRHPNRHPKTSSQARRWGGMTGELVDREINDRRTERQHRSDVRAERRKAKQNLTW